MLLLFPDDFHGLSIDSSLTLTVLSGSLCNPQHPDKCDDILVLCQSESYEKSSEEVNLYFFCSFDPARWRLRFSHFLNSFPTSPTLFTTVFFLISFP